MYWKFVVELVLYMNDETTHYERAMWVPRLTDDVRKAMSILKDSVVDNSDN